MLLPAIDVLWTLLFPSFLWKKNLKKQIFIWNSKRQRNQFLISNSIKMMWCLMSDTLRLFSLLLLKYKNSPERNDAQGYKTSSLLTARSKKDSYFQFAVQVHNSLAHSTTQAKNNFWVLSALANSTEFFKSKESVRRWILSWISRIFWFTNQTRPLKTMRRRFIQIEIHLNKK
jgi:hypothetical protein